MKGIFSILLLFLAMVVIGQAQNLYDLVLHPLDRGAACLDGSPAGLYIHPGSGDNKNKFMVYFDSGGFCGSGTLAQTLQSCYKRSFSSLGTTKNYKKQKSFDGQGLLSTKKQQNPLFYDWTKIFAIYCDGAEHQGYREKPIPYKDQNLHFRGTRNSLEQFHYLDTTYDFYNGEKIVLTGVSAGGMATFQWMNYLMDNTKKAQVLAIPDSGFFIVDFYSPIVGEKILRDRAQNLLKLVGEDREELPEPIKKCIEKPGLDLVDCYNSGNYAEFLKAPMMLIESPIDEYSLDNIVIASCLKNDEPPFSLSDCNQTAMAAIEDYRKQSLDFLKLFKERDDVGIWGPVCVQHGFTDEPTFTDPRFKVGGLMAYQAIEKFLENPSKAPWLLEEEPWPSNKGCSGLSANIRVE